MNTAIAEVNGLGRNAVGTVIAPGWKQDAGVATGKAFLDANYVEGDQVVLFGYSYGGDNAVNLARVAGVPVDAMLIVDSSDGPMRGSTVQTEVTENVNTTLNVYQRETSRGSLVTGPNSDNPNRSENSSSDGTSDSPGSRGYPHSARGNNRVHNLDASAPNVNHGNIQSAKRKTLDGFLKDVIHDYQ